MSQPMPAPQSQLFDVNEQEFEPRAAAALARLNQFLPNSGVKYAQQRNYDRGPQDRANVSLLSPYIRHRAITERTVVEHVLGRFALSTAEKFVQEVCWRTYWKGWLEHRPSVWMTYLSEVEALQQQVAGNSGRTKALSEAEAGETGIDCFDAWARELVETGYMHNHARMWFASIWIYTLNLPWQLGAAFFLRHLKDGDPASNTLSWRWVAGLHTQGKTYTARASNIAKYTDGRFNPQGQLAGEATALDGPSNPSPGMLPEATRLSPSGKTTLLLHDDDLGFETLDIRADNVRTVILLDTFSHQSAYNNSVKAFKRALLEDAAQQIEDKWQIKPQIVATSDPANAAIAISEAHKSGGAEDFVMPYAPVGFTASDIQKLTSKLKAQRVKVTTLIRDWDAGFWPHATKGFFKLKTKIPNVLREIGVAGA